MPSSILKKESSFSGEERKVDNDAEVVAVSDPALFQFDDEIERADEGRPPAEDPLNMI